MFYREILNPELSRYWSQQGPTHVMLALLINEADAAIGVEAQWKMDILRSITDLWESSLLYYKNISINPSIFQYIYVDHHRWHYVISSCNPLLHNKPPFVG